MNLTLPTRADGLLSPAWLAESVRVTAFFAPESQPKGDFWQTIMGSPPADIRVRPADNQKLEVGTLGTGILAISQAANRLDFIYSDKPEPMLMTEPVPPRLVQLGPAKSAISLLLEKVEAGGEYWKQAIRLAIGPIFVRSTKTNAEANQILRTYAGLRLADDDEDVVWQINKPVYSSLFPESLNRITKWQSASLANILVSTDGQQTLMQDTLRFVRVEVDVSTPIIFKSPLLNPVQAMKELIDTLVELVGKTYP